MTLEEVMYLIEDKEEELVELYVNLSKRSKMTKEKYNIYINTMTGEIVNEYLSFYEINDVNYFPLFSIDYKMKIDDEEELLNRLESSARISIISSVNNIRRKLNKKQIPVLRKYEDDYNYLIELSKKYISEDNYNIDRDIRNTFNSYNLDMSLMIMKFIKLFSINNDLIKYSSDKNPDIKKDEMFLSVEERSFFYKTKNEVTLYIYDVSMKEKAEEIIYILQKFQSDLIEKISKNFTNKDILEKFNGIDYKIFCKIDFYKSPHILEVSKNFIHF